MWRIAQLRLLARLSPVKKVSFVLLFSIASYLLFFELIPYVSPASNSMLIAFSYTSVVGIITLFIWGAASYCSPKSEKPFFILMLIAETIDSVNDCRLLFFKMVRQYSLWGEVSLYLYQLFLLAAIMFVIFHIKRLHNFTLFHLSVIPLLIGMGLLYFWVMPDNVFQSASGVLHGALLMVELLIMYFFILFATCSRSTNILLLSIAYMSSVAANITNTRQVWETIAFSNKLLGFLDMFGYLFAFFAVLFIFLNNKYRPRCWFYPLNSIQPQTALWTANISVSMFIIVILFLFSFDFSLVRFFHIKDALPIFCIFLIICTLFSVSIARYLSGSFYKLILVIKQYSRRKVSLSPSKRKRMLLLREFNLLNRFSKKTLMSIKQQRENEKKLFSIASQTVHDIRSPLTLLQLITDNLSGSIDRLKQVEINKSIARIQSVSDDLLEHYRDVILGRVVRKKNLRCEFIIGIVSELMKEKEVLYANRPIVFVKSVGDRAYAVRALIDKGLLKRVLSNIMDNAVQSIEQAGQVQLSIVLEDEGKKVVLRVEDNGCGISADQLNAISQGCAVSSKKGGTGIGLTSSIKTIRHWGGDIQVESVLGQGSTISIALPAIPPPECLPTQIDIKSVHKIILYDDSQEDLEINSLTLQNRINNNIVIETCCDEVVLGKYIQSEAGSTLFFIDYHYENIDKTGVDWIIDNNLLTRSILVSHEQSEMLIATCLHHNITYLPKALLPYVPFSC